MLSTDGAPNIPIKFNNSTSSKFTTIALVFETNLNLPRSRQELTKQPCCKNKPPSQSVKSQRLEVIVCFEISNSKTRNTFVSNHTFSVVYIDGWREFLRSPNLETGVSSAEVRGQRKSRSPGVKVNVYISRSPVTFRLRSPSLCNLTALFYRSNIISSIVSRF